MSEQASTQPRWILSFADLLSVVLSFLVLAYSISLPPKTKPAKFEKTQVANYSVKKDEHTEDISIAKNNDDLSTNYLYQVIEKKISTDAELAAKIKFRSSGENLVLTISKTDFAVVYSKLSQVLKVIENKTSIYTANLDDSAKIYSFLQEKGFNKKIMIMETDMPKAQIDFVINP